MLKMVFLVLLFFGLIFNLATIELSFSINSYGQIPYLPPPASSPPPSSPPPPSLPNQEEQQQSSSSALTSVGEKNSQGTALNGLNNNTSKLVIITFGDGLQSQYIYAKPILDKYGFKANFFVTCNKVGLTNSKITWQEIVQLYKEGHVIGSKTVDYGTKAKGKGDIDLNHLSANKLEYEVGQSRQCLLDHGINSQNEIISAYTDVSYTNKSSDITLNLFEAEMKYLHDNGFRVITFYDLGYDQNSNSFFLH